MLLFSAGPGRGRPSSHNNNNNKNDTNATVLARLSGWGRRGRSTRHSEWLRCSSGNTCTLPNLVLVIKSLSLHVEDAQFDIFLVGTRVVLVGKAGVGVGRSGAAMRSGHMQYNTSHRIKQNMDPAPYFAPLHPATTLPTKPAHPASSYSSSTPHL